MKIISKHKDFYDFLCQDNDADLHYVRTPFFVTTDYTHMYRQTFEHQSFHVSSNFERWYYPKSVGSIFMSAIIYGIYPYVWKYECPEIFKRIGAPVFIDANDKVLGNIYNTSMDFKRIGDGKYIKYVANICFNKLGVNVLKCWFDELNDINTYINIENFLWSIKQEPENDPDDKTKIINHGFDLKTSFRKV